MADAFAKSSIVKSAMNAACALDLSIEWQKRMPAVSSKNEVKSKGLQKKNLKPC